MPALVSRFAAAGVLAVVLVVAPAPVAARSATSDVLVTEAGTRFALVSCTIRNTGSGWAVINDGGHTPSGCAGVVTHPDHLELQHPVGAVRVSSLTVTPDETFARAGLRVGASVGFDLSNLFLYSGAAGSAPLDPATVSSPTGNLWVYGLLRL